MPSLKPGDVLNLRDLEQAIENFRRVPSAQAEIVVEPVQGAPGRSDLVIRYQQAPVSPVPLRRRQRHQSHRQIPGQHDLQLRQLVDAQRPVLCHR
jgi:hypothetical protein